MHSKLIKILSIILCVYSLNSCNKKKQQKQEEQQQEKINSIIDNYYSSVNFELFQEQLLISLSTRINKGVFTQGYDDLYTAYATTDIKENGYIWCMYSDKDFEYGTNEDHGTSSLVPLSETYNREHVVCQSWFSNSGCQDKLKTDLFNVYPCDRSLNSIRNNDPHGDVDSSTYLEGSYYCKRGKCKTNSSLTVFEVSDEYKGDFARSYFYVATRYYQYTSKFGSEGSNIFKGSFPYLTDFALNQYLSWAKLDPVSQKEIDRNNAVYAIQMNRNPYIDHEELLYKVFDVNYYTSNYASL